MLKAKKMKNLTNEIKSGNIIVTINGIDIKNLPTIDEKTIVNNQFLLDNNYCKKINSPPISWI
jgi:preprotein translocase subunit YajC